MGGSRRRVGGPENLRHGKICRLLLRRGRLTRMRAEHPMPQDCTGGPGRALLHIDEASLIEAVWIALARC
jgi:hypothetical protein